jgi:hypothetical protein
LYHSPHASKIHHNIQVSNHQDPFIKYSLTHLNWTIINNQNNNNKSQIANKNHIHTTDKNIPKLAKSRKAVGFAIVANANRNHEIIVYFIISSLNKTFLVSSNLIFLTKTIQLYIANTINDNTHKSVLLSTNTKNDHIQLVNHNNNKNRHI